MRSPVIIAHVFALKNTLNMQHLNAKCDEAEDGARPEEQGEAGEEALAELDPFWGGGRGGQLVQAVLGDPLPHLSSSYKWLKPRILKTWSSVRPSVTSEENLLQSSSMLTWTPAC